MDMVKMRQPRITLKQAALLRKLTLSSAFTQSEFRATLDFVFDGKATREDAATLIERALARIKERNERRKRQKALADNLRKEQTD